MTELILYEVKDGVAYLTLNRPDRRNALTQEMMAGIVEGLEAAEADDQVRVVCLGANGDKAFCAGADLGSAIPSAGGQSGGGMQNYAGMLKKLANFPKPVLAKVGGPSLAGGLGLMLACDIIIAKDGIFFSAPEVNIGIFPFMVGAMLWRDVAWKKAMDLVLTGRRVGTAEAEAMGLISRAVAAERFEEEVAETLAQMALRSPVGMRLGKEAFRKLQGMPLNQALDELCLALGESVRTEDAQEGLKAYKEKRQPVFQGK